MVPKMSGFNQSETACGLPSKLKLHNNQTVVYVDAMFNSTIFRKELFSRFLLSVMHAAMAILLNSLSFVFKILFLPNYRVKIILILFL